MKLLIELQSNFAVRSFASFSCPMIVNTGRPPSQFDGLWYHNNNPHNRQSGLSRNQHGGIIAQEERINRSWDRHLRSVGRQAGPRAPWWMDARISRWGSSNGVLYFVNIIVSLQIDRHPLSTRSTTTTSRQLSRKVNWASTFTLEFIDTFEGYYQQRWWCL